MTRRTHSTGEQAELADRSPEVGEAIGPYRLIGVIGDGSLGRLYVAEQHGIRGVSKTVALRCVRPELARQAEFRAYFAEASSIAARAEHPNVLSVFELASIDGRYIVSMEYLPGETLASVLARALVDRRDGGSSFSPDIAAYVVKHVASALQYVHDLRETAAQGVSPRHQGVDTSSIFISYHGTVKWLGLGLGALAQPSPAVEAPQSSAGAESGVSTPAGRDIGADSPTDVFNLGVLLWTCLVGEKPAAGATPPGLEGADPSGTVPAALLAPPSSLRANVPEALDRIVKQALSSDPLERFQSPHAMADALEKYLFRRDTRPTPKHLRRWMEQSFGAGRASLQMQIARGRDVEAALSRLGAADSASGAAAPLAAPRPRELWSTSHSVFSELTRASIAPPRSFERIPGSPDERSHVTSILTRQMPPSFMRVPASLANAELPALEPAPVAPALVPPSQPASRGWLLAAGAVVCAAVALGLILVVATGSQSSPFGAKTQGATSADRSGRLEIRSMPEGAAIFVDGEPTGLRTPALLKGLAPGRTLHLRVEKAGFASQERQLEIGPGSMMTPVFELRASEGRVRFVGAPRNARIYVDDVPVALGAGAAINLPVGEHTLRVETPDALVFSGRVDVVAGEQTINAGGDRAIP